jgi:nucleotide-binding universal stress UspA family protein
VLDARLTLLHVIEPAVYPQFYAVDVLPQPTLRSVHERATANLEELVDHHLDGVRTEVRVTVGHAADTIVTEARDSGQDLVVMGKRGLSDLESILLGSVAEYVLRRSPVPALTVRGRD